MLLHLQQMLRHVIVILERYYLYDATGFILLQRLMLLVVIVQQLLNLTINNATTSTTDVTACDSYDWNGTAYTTTNATGLTFIRLQRLMLLVVIVQLL